METTSTLVCQFKDSLGKTYNLNIDYPIYDIDPVTLKTFMETAISNNVLIVDNDNLDNQLTSIAGAYISKKSVFNIAL
ncbi:MAG TPA: DUF2922 domain-containing protein [Firmicutes bacterium]|nr:DUF2922 domain-containing protein [Bacillota bacterium]